MRRGPGGHRWVHWSYPAWGALSLAALCALQVGLWPRSWLPPDTPKWEALQALNSALLIIGLVYVVACALAFSRWLHQNVPLAARRRATLERRSIGDFVPPAIQYAVYGLVAVHLLVWLWFAVRLDHPTAAFWGALGFQVVVAGAFLIALLGAVRRRPGAMDHLFGPAYRRTEVRLALAAQLLPLVNGVARLYEQVGNGTPALVDRIAHLGLVSGVVAQAVLVVMWSRQNDDRGSASSPRAVGSLGTLGVIVLAATTASTLAIVPADPQRGFDNDLRTRPASRR
jgi:hypothetical protein